MQFLYSAQITWNAGFVRTKSRILAVNYSPICRFGRKASGLKRSIKYILLSYFQKDHFCILAGLVSDLEVKLLSYDTKSKYETKKFRIKRSEVPSHYQTSETRKTTKSK